MKAITKALLRATEMMEQFMDNIFQCMRSFVEKEGKSAMG